MPANLSLSYNQSVLESRTFDEIKPRNISLKKLSTNTNVGAFKTEKLDSYTLVNFAKFMTYSFYNIWDNNTNQDIYDGYGNSLMPYFHQSAQSEVNPNFDYFQEFCEKILGATETSLSLCLCTLKLIDRLRQKNNDASGSEGFEFRIFIAAYIIAIKFFTERSINNKAWEPVCGMDVAQINIMEIEMLFGISFNINITSEEFIEWIQEIDFIFSNNLMTSFWYIQEIKPKLSSIVSEVNGIMMNNKETIAYHDSQDTNVDYQKSSTSKPMISYYDDGSSSGSSSVGVSEYDDSLILEEESFHYSLTPESITSSESSILTR